MTSDTSKLSVVGAAPTGEAGESLAHRTSEPDAPGGAGSKEPKRFVWLLAALLLVVSAFLITQAQRVNELDQQVQALTYELTTARSDIEAQRQHLRVVRGEVKGVHAAAGDLERRIAELGVLADLDPLETR